MSIQAVRAYFEALGLGARVLEFESSSATVELAAQAVGCAPSRIAKSLSFAVDEGCVLVVAAGDARIDNPKFKAFFGVKAKMLAAAQLPALVGHEVGGVCPFAILDTAKVYLDVSLQRFDVVYPACGSASSAIGLSCQELSQYAQNVQGWVDVCKDWQENAQP